MARKMSLAELEEQLLCPICLEVFREPQMLQCGHSFCQPCALSLHRQGQEGQFPCPVCCQPVPRGPPAPNVTLARLIEVLRSRGEAEPPPESCPTHHNPLSLFCELDREVICGLCGTIGAHRQHRITPVPAVHCRMKVFLTKKLKISRTCGTPESLGKAQENVAQEGHVLLGGDTHCLGARRFPGRKEATSMVLCFQEELSVLLTDIQQCQRNLEEQCSKLINNKSRVAAEVDVYKWAIRKEFQELHRYIDEEKATFLGSIEGKAAQLISSIEAQVKQTSDALQRLREIQSSLEALGNENQLDFVRKYGSSQFRSELPSLQPADGTFSPVSFKPCFHQDDIKMTVWKRLHRRVLPAPEALKLDPVTAHPLLELSKGDTVVQCGLSQRRDSNPQRFNSSNCILTSKGFSCGRHYWEVIVGTRNHWRLGVIRGTVSRKGKLSKCPESGVWLIGLKDGKVYEAFSSPRVLLPLTARPRRIGLFLHYERGQLSFYNADSPDELSPIYTFQAEFQGQLYPIVDLCWPERGSYSPPIILPAPAVSRHPWAPHPAPREHTEP